MALRIPTSISDFRKLREQQFEYIDKTHLITELIDRDSYEVVLIPRPRRFGKSLNLSMLKWFFEKRDENLWHLFDGLHVAQAGPKYREHFQKYPVVHISFKGAKADNFEVCHEKIRLLIRDMYTYHRPVIEGQLDEVDQQDFDAIRKGTAAGWQFQRSLYYLTKYLHQVHGVRPIVLIDEYDAPIHTGYANGYYKQVVGFFQSFFEAGLKDNEHLERGVMTGILRTSKESIFSELNSLGVFTLIDTEFNTCFGFTEAEVTALLQKAGMIDLLDAVRSYYDGYEFGMVDIYNPWSILSFLARDDRNVIPYWVGTSSNMLVKDLLQHHAFAVQNDVKTLLEGGYIEEHINENIVFPDIRRRTQALWNMLVFTGYLKASRPGPILRGEDRPPFRLSIPNREVAVVYRTTFQSWMDEALTARGGGLKELLDALLQGDVRGFEQQLQKFAASLPSYHDVEGAQPEKFYHGMVIGLLAGLEPDYEVRSNRESGPGRPDVLIKPRLAGKPGVVLELKAAEPGQKSIEKAMAEGLLQLETHDYGAELRAAGVEKIQQLAVAFDGKRVMVLPKGAPAPKKKAVPKNSQESVRTGAKKAPAAKRPKTGAKNKKTTKK